MNLPPFSHIYFETRTRDFECANQVRARYRDLPQTEIADYGMLFNRKKQHFQIQKRAQALILAVKTGQLLYEGTERVRSFGDAHIYYTDQMRNCIYNCSYCFLQGMHQSAHCVLFVNEADYHRTVEDELRTRPLLHLSISYLSDLLAVEHLTPLCRGWIELARRHPKLKLEIRTKSNNIGALDGLEPAENVRLVWSLTPRSYAQRHEHGTASLPNRLLSVRAAIERGWQVALCFDPVIFGDGWETEYRRLLEETFTSLPAHKVSLVSYGTFRMHRDYFKRMVSQQPKSEILLQEYQEEKRLTTHTAATQQQIRQTFEQQIEAHYPLEKVFFVHG